MTCKLPAASAAGDRRAPLPPEWVERLFARLHGIYGTVFTGRFATGAGAGGKDTGLENAKRVWGQELAGFADRPDAIAYALGELDPRFPPSARDFLAACRRAPTPPGPRKLAHVISPEEIDRSRARIAGLRQTFPGVFARMVIDQMEQEGGGNE